jgi:hypothetical protein
MGVTVREAFEIARSIVEAEVRRLHEADPRQHGAVLAQAVVLASPTLWKVYRAGIRRGLLPEFEKVRPTNTKRWRLYHQIDAEMRRVVLASPRPLTMRLAIDQVYRERPDLFVAYHLALTKERASIRTRRRKV